LEGVVREFGVFVDVKRISNFILVCNCPQFPRQAGRDRIESWDE